MSLKTWRKKFYPIDAFVAAEKGELAAARHSLRKWEGLRKEVLKEHGVLFVAGSLVNAVDDAPGYTLDIDASSCALCEFNFNERRFRGCNGCALARARDGYACDQQHSGEDESPWWIWGEGQNPEPMIRDLKLAVKLLKEETKHDA